MSIYKDRCKILGAVLKHTEFPYWISNRRYRRLYHGLIPIQCVINLTYCSDICFNDGFIYYPEMHYKSRQMTTQLELSL